ncbi:MAG: hypothetical protein U0790_25325 [Isosphaeraceae bacterium]
MLRGITISVNYGPLLAITLVRNMRHLAECLVITSPEDEETQAVACAVPGVRLHITDAFTRHGARFNKGLAFEEGFEVLGRRGRMLIWDADILFPEEIELSDWRSNCLHGARRRLLEDPTAWSPDLDWRSLPYVRDGGPIGFFQAFDADDPAIAAKRPWYDVSFTHAGGGDAYFMTHWTNDRRRVLPIDVLHLGPNDRNWFGVDQAGRDMMSAFVIRNGWHRASMKADHSALERVGEITERVDVPGYAPTGFDLPFVQRTKAMRAAGG